MVFCASAPVVVWSATLRAETVAAFEASSLSPGAVPKSLPRGDDSAKPDAHHWRMRAITVSEYGGSPVVTELPKPNPGPGQLLIKVRAASVNPMDRNIAGGAMKEQMPGTFP